MSGDPAQFSIIIVGAGLAGLATSIALSQKGHHVQVLEQRGRLSITGGGLQLGSNATRLLTEWGLDSRLEAIGNPEPTIFVRRYRDSHVLQVRNIPNVSSFPSWVVLRRELQRLLYESALSSGVQVHFRKHVKSLDETRPAVLLDDGSTWEGDLIVGADGVRSELRTLLFPNKDVRPRATDSCAFQFIVPRSVMDSHEHTRRLYDDPGMSTWVGPGRRVVAFSVRKQEYYYMACIDEGHGPLGEPGTWNEQGDVVDMRSRFQMFAPELRTLLAKVERCDKWRLAEGTDLDSLTSATGKVVLLGDAAHAMLPNAGQGASQGVEDAGALAELLSYATSPKDIPGIIRAYQDFRQPRTTKIKKYSARLAEATRLPEGAEQDRRDRSLREHAGDVNPTDPENLKADVDAPYRTLAFFKWIYDYDTKNEVLYLSVPDLENGSAVWWLTKTQARRFWEARKDGKDMGTTGNKADTALNPRDRRLARL